MRVHPALTALAAAVAVCAAPAGPASAEETAQETIARLQKEGYTVTIDKIGTGPLSTCVVTSVRNPQTMTQWVPYVGPVIGGGRRDGNFLVPVVTSRFISVSVVCPGR